MMFSGSRRIKTAVATLAVLGLSPNAYSAQTDELERQHPGATAFIEEIAADQQLDADWLADILSQAEKKQSIIDAISRPAEGKPWYQYRPIFMTDARIRNGLQFWRENRELLEKVEREFGVPANIIVAIIGVETSYGRITGSYRVLDSLATLSFHYPPRAKFFRKELGHFLNLSKKESLPLDEVTGSYAGAMGLGQFISSSYLSYAVDFDNDGRRDLWGSKPDAIASVANYFKRHGWRAGEPVAFPAKANGDARKLKDISIKPSYPASQIQQWGYASEQPIDGDPVATLIDLETESGREYWIGFHNFYVISRYNHSALYSMAVFQLSQALAEQFDAS